MVWIHQVIMEEVEIRNLYLGNNTPQEKLAYRYFMLQSLDAAFREFDGVEGAVPVRRFTLIPTHACGGSMKATFSGCVMWKLLSKIKKSHPAFYKYVRSLPEYDQRKLYTYFRYEKKNGWERGRQVRSKRGGITPSLREEQSLHVQRKTEEAEA